MTENEVIAILKKFIKCEFCLYNRPIVSCRGNDCFELDLNKLSEYFENKSEVD